MASLDSLSSTFAIKHIKKSSKDKNCRKRTASWQKYLLTEVDTAILPEQMMIENNGT